MNKHKARIDSRPMAISLTFALTLPSPAFALHTQSPLEAATKSGLEESLRQEPRSVSTSLVNRSESSSAAGLEEVDAEVKELLSEFLTTEIHSQLDLLATRLPKFTLQQRVQFLHSLVWIDPAPPTRLIADTLIQNDPAARTVRGQILQAVSESGRDGLVIWEELLANLPEADDVTRMRKALPPALNAFSEPYPERLRIALLIISGSGTVEASLRQLEAKIRAHPTDSELYKQAAILFQTESETHRRILNTGINTGIKEGEVSERMQIAQELATLNYLIHKELLLRQQDAQVEIPKSLAKEIGQWREKMQSKMKESYSHLRGIFDISEGQISPSSPIYVRRRLERLARLEDLYGTYLTLTLEPTGQEARSHLDEAGKLRNRMSDLNNRQRQLLGFSGPATGLEEGETVDLVDEASLTKRFRESAEALHLPFDSNTPVFLWIGSELGGATPAMFNGIFKTEGARYFDGRQPILLPLQIPVNDFERLFPLILRHPQVRGLNMTTPYKTTVAEKAARFGIQLDETARQIGVASALHREIKNEETRWIGSIPDGEGFVQVYQSYLPRGSFKGTRVVLFGAGGAGQAILAALAREGRRPTSVTVVESNPAHREKIGRLLFYLMPGEEIHIYASEEEAYGQIDQANVLIHATPLGKHDSKTPLRDFSHIQAGSYVFDINWWRVLETPDLFGHLTPFLANARRRKAHIFNGLRMSAFLNAWFVARWFGFENHEQRLGHIDQRMREHTLSLGFKEADTAGLEEALYNVQTDEINVPLFERLVSEAARLASKREAKELGPTRRIEAVIIGGMRWRGTGKVKDGDVDLFVIDGGFFPGQEAFFNALNELVKPFGCSIQWEYVEWGRYFTHLVVPSKQIRLDIERIDSWDKVLEMVFEGMRQAMLRNPARRDKGYVETLYYLRPQERYHQALELLERGDLQGLRAQMANDTKDLRRLLEGELTPELRGQIATRLREPILPATGLEEREIYKGSDLSAETLTTIFDEHKPGIVEIWIEKFGKKKFFKRLSIGEKLSSWIDWKEIFLKDVEIWTRMQSAKSYDVRIFVSREFGEAPVATIALHSTGLEEGKYPSANPVVILGPSALALPRVRETVELLREAGLEEWLIVLPDAGLSPDELNQRLVELATRIFRVPDPVFIVYASTGDLVAKRFEVIVHSANVALERRPPASLQRIVSQILDDLGNPKGMAPELFFEWFISLSGVEQAA